MGRPGRRRNRTAAESIVADGVAWPLQMLPECRGWRDLTISCGKIPVRQRVKQLERQLPVPPSLNGRSPWCMVAMRMCNRKCVAETRIFIYFALMRSRRKIQINEDPAAVDILRSSQENSSIE